MCSFNRGRTGKVYLIIYCDCKEQQEAESSECFAKQQLNHITKTQFFWLTEFQRPPRQKLNLSMIVFGAKAFAFVSGWQIYIILMFMRLSNPCILYCWPVLVHFFVEQLMLCSKIYCIVVHCKNIIMSYVNEYIKEIGSTLT